MLPQNVVDDLELEKGAGDASVYESLFQPHHILGQNMIEDWKKYFTSNKQYIIDTQNVIHETDCDKSFFESHCVQENEFLEIWKDLKVPHLHFLEKYCYIEWDIVESLNQSSYFLQIMSVLNMMSPVIPLQPWHTPQPHGQPLQPGSGQLSTFPACFFVKITFMS